MRSRSLRRSARVCLGVLLIALCEGCAVQHVQMYDGPARPTDQQAIVKAAETIDGQHVQIQSVDGVATTPPLSSPLNRGFPSSVSVLPGRHTIQFTLWINNLYVDADLWWIAQAGGTYVIRHESKGYQARIWIEDASTGQSVGGTNTH